LPSNVVLIAFAIWLRALRNQPLRRRILGLRVHQLQRTIQSGIQKATNLRRILLSILVYRDHPITGGAGHAG